MNKIILYFVICVPLLLLHSCDVHEWPATPEKAQFHLKLNFETQMTQWMHEYDGSDVKEKGYGVTYDNTVGYGEIRYIVRVYPYTGKKPTADYYTHEFVYKRSLSDSYDHEVTLELPAGRYYFMVWSDIVPTRQSEYFHNADNFAEIVLSSNHKGNTDYRDAFYGGEELMLTTDVYEKAPDTLNITMKRPLAKFEFITNDVQNFIEKELEYLTKLAATRGETAPMQLDTDNYKVVFLYAGYMPNTFYIFSGEPVDSYMGVYIESRLDLLDENRASLGFDYVFVADRLSKIPIQIGLYDSDERQVALSKPIYVPLYRDHHTQVEGSFLMQHASGGIMIDPSFDGNHNIEIK